MTVRRPSAALLTQRSETGANVVAEKFRLFPGREMPAFVVPIEVDQVGIRAFDPVSMANDSSRAKSTWHIHS
jgi:hypothetical protein